MCHANPKNRINHGSDNLPLPPYKANKDNFYQQLIIL